MPSAMAKQLPSSLITYASCEMLHHLEKNQHINGGILSFYWFPNSLHNSSINFFLLIMNPEGWKLQQIHDSFRSSVSLELYLLSDFLVLWIGTILPMILIFCRYSWGSQMEVWKVWAVSGTCNRTWGVCKNRGLFFINLCLVPWSIKGTEMC